VPLTQSDEQPLVEFGPFTKGVNNRLQDHELTGDRLRQGVNLRLRDTGRLERRSGFSQVRAAVSKTHSLYTLPDYGLLFVDGTELVRYDPDTGSALILRGDMSPSAPVGYTTPPGGDVYYSDGRVTGRVLQGQNTPWGIAPPSGVPTLTPITGALPEGRYQVAFTYIDASGEESGAGLASSVQISAGYGIRVTGIEPPTTPGVTTLAVYISPPNGEVFYHAADLSTSATQFDYLTPSATGRALRTQFITPPPPGNVLAYCAGRIYIANGNTVWYTEPLQYGRCRRASNFLLFPKHVTLMAGVKDGLYVAADQTYFLDGTDPSAMAPRVVLPFGAAFGSLAAIPKPDTWTWYSDRGIVQATTGGQVKELQADELFLDAATFGASLYMEEQGVKQIISVTKPQGIAAVAAASSFVEMEVRRKGV